MATIVLVALLGLTIVFYALGIGNGSIPDPSNTNGSTSSNSSVNKPPSNVLSQTVLPPEPSVIFTRSGKVSENTQRTIRFETPIYDADEGRYVMQDVTAEITTDTIIYEVDRRNPPVLPAPGQPTPKPDMRVIAASNISFGDTIEVSAFENISDKTRFAAKEIHKLLLPN